ncbi:hypothetical protein, partial [Klebsiella pneumoniae]|uniref:hypothetical protein n=1 Tax=Klebsiella pneumoniae TaxID=573 RepID=UPI001C3E85DA
FGYGSTNIAVGSTLVASLDELYLKPNGIYTINDSGWSTANAPHCKFGTALVAGRAPNGTSGLRTSAIILPVGTSTNANAMSVVTKYG